MWAGQTCLPRAGLAAQRRQIGLSQVPLARVGTFQSQSRSAGLPQEQRRVGPQTIAPVPPGRRTW